MKERGLMQDKYIHQEFEEKWQQRWEAAGCFQWANDPAKEKYYVLEMFPYTSGRMHIGHVRNYTMGDILARMYRARGYDVLYPMGWDSFGLPAENAAITRNVHPRQFTEEAIKGMTSAMRRLGLSYDWNTELATCSPDYIRAQQILFIRMFEKGLVFPDTSFVNWCERCSTVLANEQAEGGKCWRCESSVIKKRVPQWFFNIRSYADELLDELDQLPDWPDSVKNIQRTWIGRSQGAEILFDIEGTNEPLPVFTTRPDTLCGCTFVVLAPEHNLLDRLDMTPEYRKRIETFRDEVLMQASEDRAKENLEKLGEFTGCFAVNPVNGERVPIWTANYVLMEYGTGAIMAVPAHDQRDFEFARQYGIPIRLVIAGEEMAPDQSLDEAYTGSGTMVNSGEFDGLPSEEGKKKVTAALEKKGKGQFSQQYRLQNWSVSRQRYWGNPIPIIHCESCGRGSRAGGSTARASS